MTNSQPDSQSNTAPQEPVQRHPLFFIEPLFVQVQNTLFQVPRVAFEGQEGSPFADAASLPTQNDTTAEGRTTDKPVILPVAVKDFENLLHVMYASGLVFPDYPSDISNEQWRSALRLATTWNFSDIQTKSTQALDEGITDPVERISVAREFKYREWLISGCYDLVGGSTQALEASKCADSLGWKTLALLHQARTEYDWALYGDLPRLANHLNNSGGGFIFTCPVQWCSGMHSLGASGTANCHNAHFPLTVRVAPQKTGFERRDSSLLAIIERTFEDELEGMSN